MDAASGSGYLIGVDVGGTFTDVVVADRDGGTTSFKAFSVPGSEADGVFDGLEKAATASGCSIEELLDRTTRFVHGSTVAPNALLERRGARTGFVTTKGFRDTLVMRRMLRENMYDLRAKVPDNFLRREWILEADERVDRDGAVVQPLTDDTVERLVGELRELEFEAIGISLLFSFRNTEHEERLKQAIEGSLDDVFVVISSEVAPEIRDYERASTTALSAYLGPRVRSYLLELEERLRSNGLRCELQIMRSSGGVCSAAEAAAQPVDMLLSGPAGGVAGAMKGESLREERSLITLDLGGTSCDLSVVQAGRAVSSTFLPRHTRFEGWDVLRPFLDIHALGAGGGSVAWLDNAGGLHVGPRSAGARPGPACYGRGGTVPTVTDADLRLGYLNPAYFLGREVALDEEAADRALGSLAERLGCGVVDVASAVFRIVNSAMADGIQVVLADKGFDPREFTLLCFGGAGGIHAPALIRDLGIRRLIIPRYASTFSALGLLLSDLRFDLVRSYGRDIVSIEIADVLETFEAMRCEAAAWMERAGHEAGQPWELERLADMRYVGQSHELRVMLADPLEGREDLCAAFEAVYSAAYGYISDRSLIQLMNLRGTAVGSTPRPRLAPLIADNGHGTEARPSMHRDAFFHELEDWVPTAIFDESGLSPGAEVAGPAIVELPSTTIVVRPDQRLGLDVWGNYVISGDSAEQA